MSFDNANAAPGEERRRDAPDAGRVDRELGWLDDAGAEDSSVAPADGTTHDGAAADDADSDAAVFYEDQVQPEYGILGFTLRELVIVGAWLVAFVVSFFPVGVVGGSIWTDGIGWILPIGVPTVAVFLLVLRRFSPDGIRRVGSLGIDQFLSVAASVAAVVWAQVLWAQIAATIHTGLFVVTWVAIVSQLAALILVLATVAAPLIPRLRDDFEGRMETLAHRNANPVRPVIARPRPARLVSGEPEAAEAAPVSDANTDADERAASVAFAPIDSSQGGPWPLGAAAASAPIDAAPPAPTDEDSENDVAPDNDASPENDAAPEKDHYTDPVGVLEEIFAVDSDATTQLPVVGEDDVDRTTRPRDAIVQPTAADGGAPTNAAQPFWVLAMTERDVFDEHGQVLFRIGPYAWTLVIEDRGGAYVVRHEDGRIGYLHDITDITKG